MIPFDGLNVSWHSLGMIYRLLSPLLFCLEAEAAHKMAIFGLRLLPDKEPAPPDPMLSSTVAGIHFPRPVGLAPGFDKNGQIGHKMIHFGFGSAELGTLTPFPQPGNPQPRLFRLSEDRAVINRMGFNNDGLAQAATRIAKMPRSGRVIGINIGANKDSADRVADYVTGVREMAPLADYLTVNISSPNTPGLRALQGRDALDELLGAVMRARGPSGPPVFLKVAPDLQPADIDDIAACVTSHAVDGLIVSNTTISRPLLSSQWADEAGGLSGAPLHDLSLQRLRDFRSVLGTSVPLIGVGGISSAEQAYARIRAGASLVQLYSAMVFEGPWLVARINRGLKALLQRDGLSNISQAVGLDAPA